MLCRQHPKKNPYIRQHSLESFSSNGAAWLVTEEQQAACYTEHGVGLLRDEFYIFPRTQIIGSFKRGMFRDIRGLCRGI